MLRIAKYLILILLFCLVISLSGRADDLVQPDWRGEERTTYQHWTFDTNNNPAIPEVNDNDYGTATATVTPNKFGSGWLDQLPGLGSQNGYWDLGGYRDPCSTGGKIVLEIDNEPKTGFLKEIWIQVTYFNDLTEAPFIQVPGAALVKEETYTVEEVDTGGEWLLDQSIWRIVPTPSHETIIVQSGQNGCVIDQIVVDTYSRGCAVSFDDLSNFCDQWLQDDEDLEADLHKDKHVDFKDFADFAAFWQDFCPPEWPWP